MSTRIRKIGRAGASLGIVAAAVMAGALWGHAAARGRDDEKSKLPKAVAVSIEKAFPKAKVVGVEKQRHVVLIYEVEMIQGGQEIEAEVFADGEILSVEREISAAALPKAVERALDIEARGAKIRELEQRHILAAISAARHAKPKVVYEAEVIRDGEEILIALDAAGLILSDDEEDEWEDEEDEDREDEDEDEGEWDDGGGEGDWEGDYDD